MKEDILVIGGGISGIMASLLASQAGRKVYLAEKTSMIGGNAIKFEEVYPNMECSTCMLAPKQQDLLQDGNIELLTMADILSVEGQEGNFRVKIRSRAGYVDSAACIGCGTCFDACPVSVPNDFEEKMIDRKAIFVPCSGALPNVPIIDTENCLRFTKDENCTLCKESCMFEAVDFEMNDKEMELEVGAIIIATGFEEFDASVLENIGHGRIENVYSSFEFERLYASNGPTTGVVQLRDESKPKSFAMIHCIGRDEVGYCSGVCCMNLMKLSRYAREKFHDAPIIHIYRDLCLPGKKYESFYKDTIAENVKFIKGSDIEISEQNGSAKIDFKSGEKIESLEADMVILGNAMIPSSSSNQIIDRLKVEKDEHGFIDSDPIVNIETKVPGVYVIGCAQGPKDIALSTSQAEAAVGMILQKTPVLAK
ncbi:MAG: FAD-dependent oxidoreductase [Candidatus Zixiibacteriota bacterium]